MVAVQVITGSVWIICGLVICGLASLIVFKGRADLHGYYDDDSDVDPSHVSRWAGGTGLLMGVLVVGYGLRELIYGFNATALGALLVTLLALSFLSKRFAQGLGAR